MILRRIVKIAFVLAAVLSFTGCVPDSKNVQKQEPAEAVVPVNESEPAMSSGDTNKAGVDTTANDAATNNIDPEVKKLIEDLHGDVSTRKSAVKALIKLKRQALPALPYLNAMTSDGDDGVRKYVAEAFGKIGIGKEEIVEPLAKMLKDDSEGVRANAAESLGAVKSTKAIELLVTAIHDESAVIRMKAVSALRLQGEPVVDPLLDILQNDKDNNARESAADALGSYNKYPGVAEPLIKALDDEYAGVRQRAIVSLSDIKVEGLVDKYLKLLKDESPTVRKSAAYKFRNIVEPRSVEPLIEILTSDKIWQVSDTAASSLGNQKDPKAVEPLIAALKRPQKSLRGDAAMALGEIGDKRAVPALVELLGDKDKVVHGKASNALTKIVGQKQDNWAKWWEKNKADYGDK